MEISSRMGGTSCSQPYYRNALTMKSVTVLLIQRAHTKKYCICLKCRKYLGRYFYIFLDRRKLIPLALLLKELFAQLCLTKDPPVTDLGRWMEPGKDLALNPGLSRVNGRPDFHSSGQEKFCCISEKDTAFLQQ